MNDSATDGCAPSLGLARCALAPRHLMLVARLVSPLMRCGCRLLAAGAVGAGADYVAGSAAADDSDDEDDDD